MISKAFNLAILGVLLLAQGCSPDANAELQNGERPPVTAADVEGFTPEPVSLDDLKSEIRSRKGEVVVVNFWASWCLPCRIEFPDLVKFGKEYESKGVDLVFVSTDFESEIPEAARFLKENEVPWKSYVKQGADLAFIDAFHKQWSGALPATFIYDRGGNLRAFWEGITSYEELEETVDGLL